jgi:hypothetical protein
MVSELTTSPSEDLSWVLKLAARARDENLLALGDYLEAYQDELARLRRDALRSPVSPTASPFVYTLR